LASGLEESVSGGDVAKKAGSKKHVGSSLDEWLEEEVAKDPSFAVGLNEQMEKLRRSAAQRGRIERPAASRSRKARR
jgi:hypothetical protein